MIAGVASQVSATAARTITQGDSQIRFWWVNHGQTVRQEIGGGYLWSPKREANGNRSQFYDNMRRANPGDFILSFAKGKVAHVGVAVDLAVSAPKPEEFGETGSYWSAIGWLLPVYWQALREPIPPRNILREIVPLLPAKYSPILAKNGHGNQKAYLAEISQDLFSLISGLGGFVPNKVPAGSGGWPSAIEVLDDRVEKALSDDPSLSATEKEQLVLARRGQGKFRKRVFEKEARCRLTGIDNPLLLIASHIKPWRACKDNRERLDGENGLALAPHVDLLFDKGYIGFEPNGTVIVSKRLSDADYCRLGLKSALRTNCGSFTARQAFYLRYHRKNVLIS